MATIADEDGLIAVSQRKLNETFGYGAERGFGQWTTDNVQVLINEGFLICERIPRESIKGVSSQVAHYRLVIPRGHVRTSKANTDNVVPIRKAPAASATNDAVILLVESIRNALDAFASKAA